jgi:hypothetical protein
MHQMWWVFFPEILVDFTRIVDGFQFNPPRPFFVFTSTIFSMVQVEAGDVVSCEVTGRIQSFGLAWWCSSALHDL